eukprot:m.24962 g.24962  ORF g.24962 m.24962 type:complete len:559 (+) comp4364_c0_seq1:245-1921(+)
MSMFANVRKMLAGSGSPGGSSDVGREVTIKGFTVTIQEAIAQGGFAVVFLATDASGRQYALKQVRVHDQESLASTTMEIDVMSSLTEHSNVVKLYASDVRPSGKFAEYLLLMEYCPGGHVVDIMNRRLNRPFEEKEVLKIFSDVCLGLAALHHQDPPVIHRDIKCENVLLSASHGCFKLCDFGSATKRAVLPGKENPAALVEEDLNKYTTLVYRAPEMVDLYCNREINTKADIWALGCLLYKMCFFQDAFEESTLSILSAKYTIPESCRFSAGLLELLAHMLEKDPELRWDIDQVTQQAFALRGLKCPLLASRKGSMISLKQSPERPLAAAASAAPAASAPPAATSTTPGVSRNAKHRDTFANIRTPSKSRSATPSRSDPFTPSTDPFTPTADPFTPTASSNPFSTPSASMQSAGWGFFSESGAEASSASDPRRASASAAPDRKAPPPPRAPSSGLGHRRAVSEGVAALSLSEEPGSTDNNPFFSPSVPSTPVSKAPPRRQRPASVTNPFAVDSPGATVHKAAPPPPSSQVRKAVQQAAGSHVAKANAFLAELDGDEV